MTLKTKIFSHAAAVAGLYAILAIVDTAHADSVVLTESQKDEVKCGPVKKDLVGVRFQDCYQNTTGSYSVTARLSTATFEDNGVSLIDINKDTQFGISIGAFTFSGSLNTANTSKFNQFGLQGTWTEGHEVCAKYNPNGDCTKLKKVTDGTIKISGGFYGAIITLSGKSDNDGNGQKIFTNLCDANGTGKLTEQASISVGDTIITSPIQVSCIVKQTTKYSDGSKGGPYQLTNMTIKAKLAAIY